MRRMLRDRGALLDALFIPPRPELVRTSAPIGTGGASCNTVQLCCNMVQHGATQWCSPLQQSAAGDAAGVGRSRAAYRTVPEWY